MPTHVDMVQTIFYSAKVAGTIFDGGGSSLAMPVVLLFREVSTEQDGREGNLLTSVTA